MISIYFQRTGNNILINKHGSPRSCPPAAIVAITAGGVGGGGDGVVPPTAVFVVTH